jgi:hypothetical protein
VLAPVLARLDAIPGVAASRTDASGRFFWLALEEGADATQVAALADGALGEASRLLTRAQAEAQLAAHRRGDPWLAKDEVMTLSFVESRILSVRLAGEIERRTGVTPEEREAIAEAIRLELISCLERVHGEGGRRSSGWIYTEWPAIAAAAVERCSLPVEPALRRQIADLLPTLLTR